MHHSTIQKKSLCGSINVPNFRLLIISLKNLMRQYQHKEDGGFRHTSSGNTYCYHIYRVHLTNKYSLMEKRSGRGALRATNFPGCSHLSLQPLLQMTSNLTTLVVVASRKLLLNKSFTERSSRPTQPWHSSSQTKQ